MTGIPKGNSPETAQQFRQPNARAVLVAMSDRETNESSFLTEKNQYRSEGTNTIKTLNGISRHETYIIYQAITNYIYHAC